MAAATAPTSSSSSRPSDGDEDDPFAAMIVYRRFTGGRRPASARLLSMTTILGRVVELAQELTDAPPRGARRLR